MKAPLWAHDVGFGRPGPPTLATCAAHRAEEADRKRNRTDVEEEGHALWLVMMLVWHHQG